MATGFYTGAGNTYNGTLQDSESGNGGYALPDGSTTDWSNPGRSVDIYGQADGTGNYQNVYSYDASKYSNPQLAYLDNLGNGNANGLAGMVQQLKLDPSKVIDALNQYGQSQNGDYSNLGSPYAYLQSASYYDPSMGSVINPFVNANRGSLDQGQQLTANAQIARNPSMEMHLGDYGQILAGMASILSMGAAGGAFAGAEGLGATGGLSEELPAGYAAGNGSSLSGALSNADALDSSLTSTGTAGLGQGADAEGGAAAAGSSSGEGAGGGQGGTGENTSLNNIPQFQPGSGINPQSSPQTLSDLSNYSSGDFDWTQQPQLDGGTSTGNILPESNSLPSGNTMGDNTYDPSVQDDFDRQMVSPQNGMTDDTPLGQGSYSGNPNSTWDQAKNLWQQYQSFQKSPYYQVPKTMADLYGQYQNKVSANAALDRYNQQSDPFGPQRAQYQALLGQSYSDPTGVYNSPQYQSLRDIFSKQIAAKDAAAGRNSQSGARALMMQDNFNTYLNQYRQGLQQAAGTGISPNMSGLQQIYGAAGNANKGMLTSLANPQLWNSIFS